MMPSANTDSFSSAPPLKRLTRLYRSLVAPLLTILMQSLMFLVDTPGVGTVAPNRYTAMMPREKSSFLRRSGVRNADANAESTDPPAERKDRSPGPGACGRSGRPGHPSACLLGARRPAAVPNPQVATVTANGPGTHSWGRARSIIPATVRSQYRQPQ